MTQRITSSTRLFVIDAAHTTLDPLLDSFPADKSVTLTEPGDWNHLFAEEVATTRLFKGTLPYGIHRMTTGTPAYIAVIHSPLKIAMRLYEQQLENTHFAGSFDDFLHSAAQRRIDNLQTRLLSNREHIWLAPQLEEAKRVLERDIAFVCTADNHVDIPFLLAYTFHLPPLNVVSQWQQSESSAESDSEAAKPTRQSSIWVETLSLSTLALVDTVFALDRQLHKAAHEIFIRRLDAARRDLLLRHSGALPPPVSPSPKTGGLIEDMESGSGDEGSFTGVGGEIESLDVLFETFSARLMQTFTPSTVPASENAPVFLGHVDSPSPGATIGGIFDIEGWLITTAPEPAHIQLFIDQQPVWGFVQRQPRPDVIAAQRHLRHTTMNPGFTLPLDTTHFSDGHHTLTCVVWNTADALVLASNEITILNG